MFESFIAKRYTHSKHKINLVTIISILSTLGITIGVAALIVVLSVFNGFGSIVSSILVSFDPHIRITQISENPSLSIDSLFQFCNELDGIESVVKFAEGKTILLKNNGYEIVNLKGINEVSNGNDWGVVTKIIAGKFDFTSNIYNNKILLGLPVALRLSCRPGDTLYVTSANDIQKSVVGLSMPKTTRLIVAGVFETNNKDYDNSFVFTTLPRSQRIFGLKNHYTGIEIRLKNIDNAEKVKNKLLTKFSKSDYSFESWYDLHKDLYGVMLIERWSAFIILLLIVIVATFNILGSLTMSVVEKKKDIGVLKSMGADNKSIMKIFMYEGLLIGVTGTIVGFIIGLGICYAQLIFNFYPLDATKYIINSMPVVIKLSDLIVIGITSLVLALFAAYYPAKRAVKTKTIDAIRWE